MDTLKKEILKLENDISYLETKKHKLDNLIEDVDYFETQKQFKKSELDDIEKQSSTVKKNISNQELYFQNTSIQHQKKIDDPN